MDITREREKSISLEEELITVKERSIDALRASEKELLHIRTDVDNLNRQLQQERSKNKELERK
ncbi:hypothetical protein Pmar_PMAR022491 [Perkinsus marinus ATCC 50983]|uniref:Uncharacterized protein n=1 Tax=Perkinsus marinus (strain ATCC 50983 / TXsc) TaxID=423536 RepID=C5KNE3_PERM5|nr:hypothetical protein Pmar_PMAR022491 [Perkinsus marinus ATCC 50983]EER13958.1 hypothetical protein Pmar_PMAR022491 [Perkinsus marinus ATCC 50983]|eukprot:XP_002782163.1 hypothetical protein Pmar_PMAR022491 [Perkinsus marinus ATCC 50983]